MILLKIDRDGGLVWNKDEVLEQAKLHDHGLCNELTHNCKILELIWREGYEDALNQVTQMSQRSALFFAEPAGTA
jgi:hypothetical protein